MYLPKIILFILIFSCSTQSIAQVKNDAQPKKHRFAFYAGAGPNYYFNNLVVGKDLVHEFNYSFMGRFMWEPEHLLSVGVETGYYRLYTMSSSQSDQAHIANSAIPLQLVISMKFLKTFYFNFSMGQTKLINKITSSTYGNFDASTWSLADFSGTIGYKHPLKNRFSIGAETKFFYSSAFVDRNIAVFFTGGYKF